MQLVFATVYNYRSITKAHKIQFADRTILLGPNNEGKTNVLGALVLAMQCLEIFERHPLADRKGPVPSFLMRQNEYEWDRDFPIQKQKSHPNGKTEITLEFQLDESELREFKTETGSQLNGTLAVKVSLGPTGVEFRIQKQGLGGKALNQKRQKVAAFLSSRIELEHIPAIRTAASAVRVVESLLGRELSVLEKDTAYQDALNTLSRLQEPILRKLSEGIATTLRQFVKSIRSVEIRISEESRHRALRRSCEFWVDDGLRTKLENKGDGVKSLSALALMRHASESRAIGKNLVIALEEPESHLHPAAIHELRSVINDLGGRHQVVLTTHNPLFVDRTRIPHNIVVMRNRARPAKDIEELRSILGVRAADNLRNASLVLVVEGNDDKASLGTLLRHGSGQIAQAFDSNLLVIDVLGGGGNLGYKIGLIRQSLCNVLCFLDHDKMGRQAFNKAKESNLVSDAEVSFTIVRGFPESEFEDLLDPKIYQARIQSDYGIDLRRTSFKRTREKWSDRMGRVFAESGKAWDDRMKADVKRALSECVQQHPETALMTGRRMPFDALVRVIEDQIKLQQR